MAPRSPAYTIRNYFGIYLFQYRFPKAVRELCTSLQVLFRRSLHTRSKRVADERARRWWVIIDELAKRFFHDPDAYAQAIKLLARYEAVENLNWQGAVEDYLSQLEEGESGLLELAIKHRHEAQKNQLQTQDRIASLERTVEALSQSTLAGSKWKSPDANPAESLQLTEPVTDRIAAAKTTNPYLDSNAPLLSEVRQKFLDYKKDHVKAGRLVAIQSKIDLFLKFLTEQHGNTVPRVSELSPQLMRNFRDALLKIPAQRATLPKHLSVAEMIRLNKRPISATTAKDTRIIIGLFMSWIQTEGYPIDTSLKGILSSVKAPKKKNGTKRLDFSPENLERMFHSELYLSGLFKRPSEYWVPLIALFTGARLAEIVQLHCADIHEEQGVWVFNLNDEGDKQLKTETSNRLVPVHSKLIELGLLDFVKLRFKTHKCLFPEEERTDTGKFDAYSKRFAYFRKKVGVVAEEGVLLDFHSFRHTVRTKLTEASIQESLIDDIVGHASEGRSIGRKNYTHTQLIPQKKEAIEKLDYGLDFAKLKPWEHCRFFRTLAANKPKKPAK